MLIQPSLKLRRILSVLMLAIAGLFMTGNAQAIGVWTPLANQAPDGVAQMQLLTDGTVIASGGTAIWYRLTANTNGSYLNGTWSAIAPMHDPRLYFASQVLPDGRLFVCGGEYGTGKNRAEVYQPTNNSWMQAATPPGLAIDDISETLPNGNVLVGNAAADIHIYNIFTNGWSANTLPLSGQNEASWVKLQDGSILTIDPFGTNSERFIPALNKWVRDGTVPVAMYAPQDGEIGTGALLPNGKTIFFGGTGHNAIYTPWTNIAGIYTPAGTTNAGTWAAASDTPGAILRMTRRGP